MDVSIVTVTLSLGCVHPVECIKSVAYGRKNRGRADPTWITPVLTETVQPYVASRGRSVIGESRQRRLRARLQPGLRGQPWTLCFKSGRSICSTETAWQSFAPSWMRILAAAWPAPVSSAQTESAPRPRRAIPPANQLPLIILESATGEGGMGHCCQHYCSPEVYSKVGGFDP